MSKLPNPHVICSVKRYIYAIRVTSHQQPHKPTSLSEWLSGYLRLNGGARAENLGKLRRVHDIVHHEL